ncbi:MAG: hypothetical protein R3C28_11515 [Pirellulaceae bacterium]
MKRRKKRTNGNLVLVLAASLILLGLLMDAAGMTTDQSQIATVILSWMQR